MDNNLEINQQLIKLGLNVLYYRKLRNLTQEELSEKANVSAVVISRIESQNSFTNPEVTTILKIAYGLNVPPNKFFEFRNYDS